MTTFQQGDRVGFYSRGTRIEAEVVRVNEATVLVRTDDGQTRRVQRARLELLPALDNVIPFPSHGCGVGRRVWFRSREGAPIVGIIVGINAHSAQIRPDDGTVPYWRVAHEHIRRVEDELPKRPDHLVLQDIARCYARLEHTWKPGRQPHVRRQINQRLKTLFKELGRYVDADEALTWALKEPRA